MSAQDDLNAAALDYAVSQGYQPPGPPPPPNPVYLFDGRASTTSLPLPTLSGTGQSVVQTPPNPYPVWDGYTNPPDSVTVVDNPRWGKVYHWSPKAGQHSPYNMNPSPPNQTFTELTKRRNTGLTQTLWFADAMTILANGQPGWATFLSLGYQTILYDQIGFGVGAAGNDANTWSIRVNSGLVANSQPAVTISQGLKPVIIGQECDWIIGVKVAADTTGYVEVHYRPEGGTWSQLYTKSGIPTVEWTNTSGTPVVGATVLDKAGMYCAPWSTSAAPVTMELVTRGMSRHPTLQDAIASLA